MFLVSELGRMSEQSGERSRGSAIIEIKPPPAIAVFQRYLPPAKRHLRVRIKRTNIGPRTRRVRSRVGNLCEVRVGSVGGPSVIRQVVVVELSRHHSSVMSMHHLLLHHVLVHHRLLHHLLLHHRLVLLLLHTRMLCHRDRHERMP